MVRHAADQHLVEDDAEAVQIRASIQLLAARLLGAHVVRRAHHRAGARHARRRIIGAGDAEIGQRRGAVIAQQDVVGLDVAVDETLLLRVVDRAGDFARHAQGEGDRAWRAVLAQHRTAGKIFHRHVVIVAAAADIVDADDVAMMQARGDLGLAQEALAKIRIDQQGRRHDLQRDFAIHRFLDRQIHRGHAAAAKLAQQAVSWNFNHVGTLSMPNAALQRGC